MSQSEASSDPGILLVCSECPVGLDQVEANSEGGTEAQGLDVFSWSLSVSLATPCLIFSNNRSQRLRDITDATRRRPGIQELMSAKHFELVGRKALDKYKVLLLLQGRKSNCQLRVYNQEANIVSGGFDNRISMKMWHAVSLLTEML